MGVKWVCLDEGGCDYDNLVNSLVTDELSKPDG